MEIKLIDKYIRKMPFIPTLPTYKGYVSVRVFQDKHNHVAVAYDERTQYKLAKAHFKATLHDEIYKEYQNFHALLKWWKERKKIDWFIYDLLPKDFLIKQNIIRSLPRG